MCVGVVHAMTKLLSVSGSAADADSDSADLVRNLRCVVRDSRRVPSGPLTQSSLLSLSSVGMSSMPLLCIGESTHDSSRPDLQLGLTTQTKERHTRGTVGRTHHGA